MKTILFIVTSANMLAGSPTGIWFEELSTPYYILKDAGYNIEIISPKGGKVPYDKKALEPDAITDSVTKFLADEEAMQKLNNSKKISETNLKNYNAIFFPGGHGAIVDLPFDKILSEKLGEFFDSGKLISAICHGPAGLVAATRADGKPIVEGLKITSFSNAEENAIGITNKLPFLMEDKFKGQGAIYSSKPNFTENVIIDKNLITGQNPASSKAIAQEIVKYLKENG